MNDVMFRLRRGTAADAPALWALRGAAIRHVCRGHYSVELIARWAASPLPAPFAAEIDRKYAIVGEAGSAIAGFTILDIAEAEVDAVFVAPAQGRRGLGRQLLAWVDAAARAAGLRALSLDASLNAVPFYAAAGYETGSRGVHTTRAGLEIACVHMRRQLAPLASGPGAPSGHR